jgi:hypothetical protein
VLIVKPMRLSSEFLAGVGSVASLRSARIGLVPSVSGGIAARHMEDIVVWKLNPADLHQLKGAGGEPFVHFMDRLIRAEAARGGLQQSAIATQLRVNIKDGGVDTQVKNRIPQDNTGWFAVATCWQFKAVDAKDIDDEERKTKKNALQEEINKPYVMELVKQGYGYRLCLLGDLTPEKLRDWEAQLKKEALIINPHAQDPRVIHGGHLLEWAERYPAIVARLRNWTQGGLHWEAWQDNCRAVTPTYVRNSEPVWEGLRQQILRHADLIGQSVGGEACLPIGGAAGVGKTRLVFETLNELPEAAGLVLYLADEQEARATATAIVTVPGQSAILVADECSPSTRHFLNENLRGHTRRIRLICLDNTGERLVSATGQVWLKGDSLTNTEAILAANFPHVPEDRRRRYVGLSKGFVRFAADMCRHDASLATGDMSSLLLSVEVYVRERLRRMSAECLPIVSMLALFNKMGFREDVAGELDSLCELTPYTQKQFHDVVRAVRESPGFVVQAGRYWYVTPEIVARVLFAEGWEHWVATNLRSFFEKLPSEFLQQLLDRVATHANEEVRSQVGAFFRDWFSGLTAHDLADPGPTALAAALVETSPIEYLPRLRGVIDAAQPGELQAIRGYPFGGPSEPRRMMVWLLERLVSFPEFFEDCEACLFRLATEESEPQIGNNATAIWANLFSIYLSGTAVPFRQRLPLLEKRTSSAVIAEARFGFGALSRALQHPEGHVLSEPVVSGRLRPDDWRPASANEEKACLCAALAICGTHLNGGSSEHHRLGFNVIMHALLYLIRRGLLPELREIMLPKSLTDDESRKLLHTLDEFLAHEHLRAETDPGYARYIEDIRDWSNQFRPNSFAGRLREVCARSPWDRRFNRNLPKDEDETAELASAILKEPALLTPELDWLASPEAQAAEQLGFHLGQVDTSGDCGPMIFDHAISHKAAPLLRGYIRGMVQAQWPPGPDFLAFMTKLESTHPVMAVDILGYAGDSYDAFNRILRLVDSGAVAVKYLANLAMGLGRRELSAAEIARVLPYFTRAAEAADAETALAGLRFLGVFLLFESRRSPSTCLNSADIRSLAWELVERVLPFVAGQMGYEWTTVVKTLTAFDPERAAKLLGHALLAEDITFRDEAKRALTELGKAHPESAMRGFGAALLDPNRGWVLQIGVCRDLIGQLPPAVVISWVREHGLHAAEAIARHLPPPYLDRNGDPVVPSLLDSILRDYDDDRVFVNFLGGAHSGEVWWRNGGAQFRDTADRAKKFLGYPNRRIREWAQNEIDYRLKLAEFEDREHEERFLPS